MYPFFVSSEVLILRRSVRAAKQEADGRYPCPPKVCKERKGLAGGLIFICGGIVCHTHFFAKINIIIHFSINFLLKFVGGYIFPCGVQIYFWKVGVDHENNGRQITRTMDARAKSTVLRASCIIL